jgi:hypothetical protein
MILRWSFPVVASVTLLAGCAYDGGYYARNDPRAGFGPPPYPGAYEPRDHGILIGRDRYEYARYYGVY